MLGAPYTHVAAAFVEALAFEAEGALAARQETVTECVKEAYSADETPGASSAAQGEGDDGVQRVRSAQERGRERGNAGRRARGKGRGASNRPDAESERGRDGSGRRSENRAGEVSGEAVARPAVCTAKVMERLRIMARTSVAVPRRSHGRHRIP